MHVCFNQDIKLTIIFQIYICIMPKVRRSRKSPPEGWELIEPTLEELEGKMREAETESHEGKRKSEALWPIFKIHHQKSRCHI